MDMSRLFDLVYRKIYTQLEQNGITMGVQTVQVCQVAAMNVLLATMRNVEGRRLQNVQINSKAVQTGAVEGPALESEEGDIIYISDTE